MRLIREVVERLRTLMFRSSEERAMDEEMRFHLEMEAEKLRGQGYAAEEAWRRARLAFGGVERMKEEVRDARGTRLLEDVWSDVRYGVRTLLRSPVFTGVAVLTLALGIGATTGIFSLANWLLLRPVPGVADPGRVAVVHFQKEAGRWTGISAPNFEEVRAEVGAFSSLTGYTRMGVQASAPDVPATTLVGEVVIGDYAGTLGLAPERGRWFVADELEKEPAALVAVISDGLWRSLFAAAPTAVGATLQMNGLDFMIVGIAPEGFRGSERLGDTDVWLPAPTYPLLRHIEGWSVADRERGLFREILGRLRPGASAELARVQLGSVVDRLVAEWPEANGIYAEFRPVVFPGIGLAPYMRPYTERTMRLLLGVVGVVLLIACANAANLLLLRGAGRRGDVALRRALGATGGRLVRQHLVEALLLALGGGAVGVLVASQFALFFRGQRLFGLPPISSVGIDGRVLLFALLASIATGVTFGILPAIVARGRDFRPEMGTWSGTAGGRGTARLRGVFTVIQVGASIALLVGALLLSRTLLNLNRVDPGFDPDGLLLFGVSPQEQGYTSAGAHALQSRILDALSGHPGVRSVSVASSTPFADLYAILRLRSAEAPPDTPPVEADVFFISPDFGATLGVPQLAGRSFTAAESFGAAGASGDGLVLSRTAAQRLFGDDDPLGRTVIEEQYRGAATRTVIGVVDDVRVSDLRAAPGPVVYQPLAAAWQSAFFVVVRTTMPRRDAEAAVRGVMARLDASLPFFQVESATESIERNTAEDRLVTRLVALLAGLAGALAAIGLYGVVASSVARRRREIGIRMALGAGRGTVIGSIARETGVLVGVGIVVGVAGAWSLSRVLASRLFGVQPLDPIAYGMAAALFMLVALAAAAGPARTATRVDPVRTLRSE
ncbi:MAG: ADOP family duplicated permease [Gemmatimonadota bacterium]|jgi:putative ABC transport system permease protein